MSLSSYDFTDDGKLLAYGLSSSGSDWSTVHVRDVETNEDLPDKVDWVKFSSPVWTHDNKGFFYARYPPASAKDKGTETDENRFHKLYYHRLGTQQHEDPLIYEAPEHPFYMFGATVTDDGNYVVLTISENTDPKNMLYVAALEGKGVPAGGLSFSKVVDSFEAEFSYITNNGPRFFFKTNLKAPCSKIVTADLGSDLSAAPAWADVVAESDPLESAQCIAEKYLVLTYLRDVKSAVMIHELETGKVVREIPIPICARAPLDVRSADPRS